jgi:hypothetical protein
MRFRKSWHNRSLKAARPPQGGDGAASSTHSRYATAPELQSDARHDSLREHCVVSRCSLGEHYVMFAGRL